MAEEEHRARRSEERLQLALRGVCHAGELPQELHVAADAAALRWEVLDEPGLEGVEALWHAELKLWEVKDVVAVGVELFELDALRVGLPQHRRDVALLVAAPEVVDADVELIPRAAEDRRVAAGDVVLVNDEHLEARSREPGGAHKAPSACADDDGVVALLLQLSQSISHGDMRLARRRWQRACTRRSLR